MRESTSNSSLVASGRRPLLVSVYAYLYIAAAMGLFAVLFVPQGQASSDVGSTPAFVISWVVLYAATALIFLLDRLRLTKTDIFLFLFSTVIIFTFVWSTNITKTVVYGCALLMNLLFVGQLRRHYCVEDFARLCLNTIFFMCFLALILHLCGFEFVRYFDPHGRPTIMGTEPLRGFFNHKITAGLYSAIGFILAASIFHGYRRLFSCAILIVFNLMTGSATGVSLLLIGVVLLWCVNFSLRRKLSTSVFIVTFGAVCLFASVFLCLLLPKILTFLGRDPTLTGRTLLWLWGVDVALQKPLFGWGYLGYLGSPEALDYASRTPEFHNYDVPHFHNGYIQAAVDLGLCGLIAYVGSFVLGFTRLYHLSRFSKTTYSTALCTLVLLIAISSIFMNNFLRYNNFITIFLAFVIVSILTQQKNRFVQRDRFEKSKISIPQKSLILNYVSSINETERSGIQ